MIEKKNISLSSDEVLDIINYIDTVIFYLANANSRFNVLDLRFYNKDIKRGIDRCLYHRNKFNKLLSKFSNDYLFIKEDDMFDTLKKLLN